MHLPLQLVLPQLMTDMRVLESTAALHAHAWERKREGNSSGSDIRANTPELKASCSGVTHAYDDVAREAAAATVTKTKNMQAACTESWIAAHLAKSPAAIWHVA